MGVRVREVQQANVSEEGLTHNLIDKGLNRSARYTAAKVWNYQMLIADPITKTELTSQNVTD